MKYPKGSTARVYYDSDNNPVPLNRLVRDEPEWAVNRIRYCEDYEQLQASNQELLSALDIKDKSYAGIYRDYRKLQASNKELLSALEYCSSYLDENKLNSIGAGSKAHMKMRDAITKANQVIGDK